MTLFRRWRVGAAVCVGLLGAVAGIRAKSPPTAPPVLPALPSQPGGAITPPIDSAKQPLALPPLPAPPASVIPPPLPAVPPSIDVVSPPSGVTPPPLSVTPAPSGIVPPKPPVPPVPEFTLTEPVATIHRFDGKYLGSDGTSALLYSPTADGKAEIQSLALGVAKGELKRAVVDRGEATAHAGRVFVVTPRELLVLGADCRVEWKFALPGKADNGESLLGVVGLDAERVLVASHHAPKPGSTEKPSGRVLGFDVASGRQVRFTTVEGGFDKDVTFRLSTAGQTFVAVGPKRAMVYPTSDFVAGAVLPFPKMPVTHLRLTPSTTVASTPGGVGLIRGRAFTIPLPEYTGTAPSAFADPDGWRFYAPVKSPAGQHVLAAVGTQAGQTQEWQVPVPKEISAPPVVRGSSVYFVAGNIVYRVNAADGAVCWKHTLDLKLGESLTELAFVGDELHASGAGLLVRIAERPEPKPPQIFFFGGVGRFGDRYAA